MKYITFLLITAFVAFAPNTFAQDEPIGSGTGGTDGGGTDKGGITGNSAYVGTTFANSHTDESGWDDEIIITDPTGAGDDQDQDGISDASDNCLNVANADQRDTDGDGFGNLCDADLDNDCIVQCSDVALMQSVFFQTGDLNADLNGDERVNYIDLAKLRDALFVAPGPSAQSNVCD